MSSSSSSFLDFDIDRLLKLDFPFDFGIGAVFLVGFDVIFGVGFGVGFGVIALFDVACGFGVDPLLGVDEAIGA